MTAACLASLAAALLAAAAVPGAGSPAGDDGPPPAPPSEASTAQAGREGAPSSGEAPEFGEEIVVTATRSARPRRDTAAATTVLTPADIERSLAKSLDELLRAVPSFGLFRQSSSLVADPSSQGVNLRGIGPSGVSRSLVLLDGIPANDPFGGWVYWRAIPILGIQRIEVVPGGGSALYGNYALGGVTQVFSRPIEPASFDASAEYGSFGSYQLGLRAADRRGPVGAVVEGQLLQSSGYPVVADGARGAVDGSARSWGGSIGARAEASPAPDLSVTARASLFYEDENGGTRYTTAAARRVEYGGVSRWTPESLGTVELSLFGHANDFKQLRARLAAQRASESLAGAQDVPAHDLGAGVLWTSQPLALAGTHTLSLGADGRRTTGATGEDLFGGAVVRRDAQGTQWSYGGFVQDVYDLSERVALQLALRYDGWQDTDAIRTERAATDAVTATPFPSRRESQVSPKAGLRVRPLQALTLRAAAYRAFRAPTLNELYRPFQVGLVRTDANEHLGPEKLKGAEAGFEIAAPFALTARLTGFWNVLQDPITNVTTGPNLRQRQNLGEARVRGLEADAEWRFARAWVATAAYTLAEATVTSAPDQPQLVGKTLPLDPRHRASFALAYDAPRLVVASVQVRYVGRQFEDDVNTLPIGEFAVVDIAVRPRIGRNVELLLAVENPLDKRYVVGRAGIDTVGQPRFVHAGVRIHSGL